MPVSPLKHFGPRPPKPGISFKAEVAADGLGHEPLTAADIAAADVVLLAVDTSVDRKTFYGQTDLRDAHQRRDSAPAGDFGCSTRPGVAESGWNTLASCARNAPLRPSGTSDQETRGHHGMPHGHRSYVYGGRGVEKIRCRLGARHTRRNAGFGRCEKPAHT
jgi:hypothetical protein